MALQTKGLCKYCGKEYTKGGMLRHLQTCKKRSAKLAEEKEDVDIFRLLLLANIKKIIG